MPKKRSPLILITLTILLNACAGMPISSMLKLRNLSPLEMNPAEISIAVITDKAVKLNDGSVSISMGFSSDAPGVSFSNRSIASITNNASLTELEDKKNDQQHITLFYLAEQAAALMRQAQNRVNIIRQQGIEGDGRLSVDILHSCFMAKRPSKLPASIYVQFDRQQGYVLMHSNIDLLELAEQVDHMWEDGQFWRECQDPDIAD